MVSITTMGDSVEKFKELRDFLKDSKRKTIDFRRSDQYLGIPEPPRQQPHAVDAVIIQLPPPDKCRQILQKIDLFEAIAARRSRRRYLDEALQLEELSFLLYATQGLRSPGIEPSQFRTVPSAGARHSFETFLFINKVESLRMGLYRYLPLSHALVFERETDRDILLQISQAVFNQHFVTKAAVVFVWTSIPYRMEWRYLESAHRVILMDAGHVCQNLYLACEAIGSGTCAIAAYDQEKMDALLGVDGHDQFTNYLAPVGKV